MLYFAAGRLPADLDGRDVSNELIVLAFERFRQELTRSKSRLTANGSNAGAVRIAGQA